MVKLICDRTGGHPFYTQHFAHDLWEITPAGTTVSEALVQQAQDMLLRRLSYAYTVLWESLSSNQQLMLKGLAGNPGARPFASAFLKTHGLANSSAHRAVEGLVERDLIDREADSSIVSDRFFWLWITRSV